MAGSAQGLNPTAALFLLMMALLLLVLPRRYSLVPMFAAACYMTVGQVVMVGSLNFSIIRILTVVGWIRLTIRGEWRLFPLHVIDRAVLYWTAASVVIYTILWGTSAAFIYKCGQAYDAVGLYFVFRSLIRSFDEITAAFRLFVWLLIPLAGFMIIEKITGRNVFGVFGGVPDFTVVREGVLRCQGPFPHSILAGTFAAALVPFFLALWWQKNGQFHSIIGLICSTAITVTSGSSGPFMTFACGLLGMGMWRLRFRMRHVRWGIVIGLLCVQLVMKNPFWFVIAHLGVFSGSTSYYRAFLIDQTIRHFSEWWLIGTKYEQPWAPMLIDITNMYVRVAFDGGLVALILFFLLLKRSYAGVGRAIRMRRLELIRDQRCIWSLGAALFAHTMTFLAVWYWDQNVVNWYILLAMIAAVSTADPKLKTQVNRTDEKADSATPQLVWS